MKRWVYYEALAVSLIAFVLIGTPFGLARPEVLALAAVGLAVLARR